MTFEEIYSAVKKYLEGKAYNKTFGQGEYSYEFDVTGEGEGRFYVEIKDGSLDIQPFDYKNSLCAFTVDSHSLRRIITGALSPVEAYSTGRLNIRGDVSAAFRLADAISAGC